MTDNLDNEEDPRYALAPTEKWWAQRYELLLKHGYRLRSRYEPGWTPSWHGTKKKPYQCEDSHKNLWLATNTANRVSDNKQVCIKQTKRTSKELDILLYLTTPEKLKDPRNPCTPILDHFMDDSEPNIVFIIMPLLRIYNRPEFFSVDEVLDFFRQIFDGILYIHSQGVAHRDICTNNILMDPNPLFKNGFHPISLSKDASGKFALPRRRTDVHYVKYYLIDFGIASRFNPGELHRVYGTDGQDDSVPELVNGAREAYDPFLVDVYTFGNLIRKDFIQIYENLRFLDPLIFDMCSKDWRHRRDIDDCRAVFETIISEQTWYALRWRLKKVESSKSSKFFQDAFSIPRIGFFAAKNAIAWPIRCITARSKPN